MDSCFNFGNTERLAVNLAQGFGVDEILIAQNGLELPGIHLRNEYSFVALHQRSKIAGQWPHMADMYVADIGARRAGTPNALLNCSERRAPANNGEFAVRSAEGDVLLGNKIGDAVDLGFADLGHLLMVGGVVTDFASIGIPLNPADPVSEAGRAWLDPEPL